MIRPRWNRHANALLADLGGSSRTVSSQYRLQHQFQSNRGNIVQSRGFSREGEREGTYSLPNRRQLDKARQELLNIDRPKSRSSSKTQASSSQLKRKPGQERSLIGSKNEGKHDKEDVEQGNHGSVGNDDVENAAPEQEWPQLKRRSRPQHILTGDGDAVLRGDQIWSTLPKNYSRRPNTAKKDNSNSSRLMLVIDGLSPNLNASDFYRLAPNDLSDWKGVIKKVQQHRDPRTLEPLGRYLVTFNSAEAAVAYRDKLLRLHRLSSLKLKSASGLWESTVPASLRTSFTTVTDDTTETSPITNDNLSDLVDTFTLAPGSQDPISILRARVAVKDSWSHHLAKLVEPLGYGEKPPVLLLDVYPPTLTAEELSSFIRRDSHIRRLRWQVSMPHPLKSGLSDAYQAANENSQEQDDDEPNPSFRLKDHDTLEKLKRRFVLVCADESEARRFHRSWNNRALTTSRPRPGRFIVHASIINW